jgi:Flp pilus assembly CpaF family ATPase
VIGGTGSGKTTLVNAIINAMVELDPSRTRFHHRGHRGNPVCRRKLRAVPHLARSDDDHALKTTLRMRPDRILVGEVRGPEALDLLMAWNTGHEGGAATLHANNAKVRD